MKKDVNAFTEIISAALLEEILCTVHLPIKQARCLIDKLIANEGKEIGKLRSILDGFMAEQRKCLPAEQEKRIEMGKERMEQWEEEFGALKMHHVLALSSTLNAPLLDLLGRKMVSPSSIKESLSRYVIGQDEYVEKLSLAFYMNYLRRNGGGEKELPRSTLLVYGPTGSGKTYAVQILSKIFNVNVGIVNCNSIVQEGIVGESITSTFTDIYLRNNNAESAVENAIIIFDEADKLFEGGEYNERIINELLSIIDENGQVFFNTSHGNRSYDSRRVSTHNMMFIFSGVFAGLEASVNKRMNVNKLGFSNGSSEVDTTHYHDFVTSEDFVNLNIKPEILGRITDYAHVRALSEGDIKEILLTSKGSPLRPFKELFREHNMELKLDEEGADILAAEAYARSLGIRGLKALLWELFTPMMKTLNAESSGEISINKEFIEQNMKELIHQM